MKLQYYLSQLNFLTTMDNSPWSEREIWPFLKASKISENGMAMSTKISLHAIFEKEIFATEKKITKRMKFKAMVALRQTNS